MHRVLVEIPLPFLDARLPIYSYGFMMMLAFVVGLYLATRRARGAGIAPQVVMDIGLYAVVSGIIGARLGFILTDLHTPRPLLEYFAIWHGGLVFQGGLLLSLATCLWYLASRGLPMGRIVDLFAPGVALGVGIGRLGCFLNGCCWGRIASHGFPLGVIFPRESYAHQHQLDLWDAGQLVPQLEAAGYGHLLADLPRALPVAVHPTQLYSAVGMVLIFLAVLAVERLPRRFDGMVMLAFLMFYSVFRFAIEFCRDDTPLRLGLDGFPGLRLGQWLAVAVFLAAAGLFAAGWRRGRPPGATGEAMPCGDR